MRVGVLELSHLGPQVRPPSRSCLCVCVQSLSRVRLFATRWPVVHQTFLFFTISWSLLKFVSIESVLLPNHRILCRPLLPLL